MDKTRFFITVHLFNATVTEIRSRVLTNFQRSSKSKDEKFATVKREKAIKSKNKDLSQKRTLYHTK